MTLQRETCDLAFTHYPTFISAAQTCKDISKDFGKVQGQLQSLEQKVPRLLETCQKFREKTAQVININVTVQVGVYIGLLRCR